MSLVNSSPAANFVPTQYHASKNHPKTSPPICSANQLSFLKSGKPETFVFWLISLKQTSVSPRRKNQKANVTIKLDKPDFTTMVPINHPNANVITRVIKKARNGVASPKPNGRPHFNIIACLLYTSPSPRD